MPPWSDWDEDFSNGNMYRSNNRLQLYSARTRSCRGSTNPMAIVEINDVSFAYAAQAVVSCVTLSIQAGEVVSLVGPSGSGKSTLLRLIAGLELPTSGRIQTNELSAREGRPGLRFLFQDYDAYPWFTVWQNVKYGSGSQPLPSDETVDEMLSQVSLSTEGTQFPGELSGGMRKRLALARCLVRRPPLLLLDEPFSSLDANLRYEMYRLVQDLWAEAGCAVLLVTHDLHEALLLADRVLVSGPGPLHIAETIEVPLPRPRTSEIENTDEYQAMLRHLTESFRNLR
jgi:ABC-type nitrate/sulfonate/bicarbonate transport system ATPase subunit